MKRIILILMSLALMLPLAVSCDVSGGGEGSDGTSDTQTPAEPITVIADGASSFITVRPDVASDTLLDKIIEWRRAIDAKYGVRVEITTDWSRDNRENNTVESGADVHEILIGGTNRAESRAVKDDYQLYCGYAIKVVNGKLVIWGSDDTNIALALDYFCENLLTEGSLTIPADYCYVWNLSGEGTPLGNLIKDFTVLYVSSNSSNLERTMGSFTDALETLSGNIVTVQSGSGADSFSGRALLIGETGAKASKDVSAELDYLDYTIRTVDDDIVVLGGSPLSTARALDVFVEKIKTGEFNSVDSFEYTYKFRDAVPDSLAWDPESFTPVWSSNFTTPAWMLDFDEKVYACVSPTGRMTTDSHRGDVQSYPENSLEGILSAALMGADVIEIDPRLTKDHVMVLMHDATLTRTTNFNEMKGKNGLPNSANIEDWTYEQLLQLNLMMGGEVTSFKIPTLYEVVKVLAGRCQIHLDVKVEEIQKNVDIYLLADELGAKSCFFYYYGASTMSSWLSYNKDDAEFAEFVRTVNSYLNRSGHSLRKRNFDLIAQYGDNATGWQKQYDTGCKMIFTNKIYDISRYIASNQSATKP